MYESFYKLHPTPFRLTPDPHFFFESKTHKRGLAYLRFAFYQREGFVVVTGAPGTGKTELMLNMVHEIPRDKVTLAKIVTSNLEADDLLDLVAASFLIDPELLSKGSMLKRLEDYFLAQSRMGKQVLLIIDEAHNLSVKSLIELSMLSNFQIDEKPLVQCFLLGQEPLEDKLRLPELTHLKQRVIASTHLEKLNPEETREYILHRLLRSGWNNNPIIRDTAFALIHFYTKGIPRRINSMCNRILLQAFLENRNDIGSDLVHQIIEELQEEIAEERINLDEDLADLQSTEKQSTYSDNYTPDPPDKQKQSSDQMASSKQNFDNVINIPEFIKKNESGRVEFKTPDLKIDAIAKSHSHIAPPINSNQSEEPGKASLNASEKTCNEINKSDDKETDYLKRKSKIISPKVSSIEEHHSTVRPSGLVDKELQFLASLNDSSGDHAHNSGKQENSKITEKDKELPPTQAKKVIIDASVYDDYGINDPEIDDSSVNINETSSKIIHHLQSIAVVAIVATAIGLSIYRWYDGEASMVNQTADANPGLVAIETLNTKMGIPDTTRADNSLAQNNVSDDETAKTSITATTNPATPEAASNIAAQSEIESVDTQSKTKPAKDIAPSADENKPVKIAGITSSDKITSELDKLDQQITDIVEKPSVKPGTVTLSTTNLPANKSEKPDSGIFLTSTAVEETNTKPATILNKNPSPDAKSGKAINMVHNANQSTKRNTQSVDKNILSTPLIGSPVVDLIRNTRPGQHIDVNLAKVSSHPVNKTSLSTTSSDSNRKTLKADAIPAISNDDLQALLFKLSNAYQMGNLQQLVSTFAPDIHSSDGSNRKQLEHDYQRLFDITDTRRLAIRDVKWHKKDKQMLGSGDFQVQIREKGANNYTTYEGKISFTVAKELNNIVIKRLDYDYNN